MRCGFLAVHAKTLRAKAYRNVRSSQMETMPAIMVSGRLRVTVAVAAAMAPAIHSSGPPESSDTETSATIRHPGRASSARAYAPDVGRVRPR